MRRRRHIPGTPAGLRTSDRQELAQQFRSDVCDYAERPHPVSTGMLHASASEVPNTRRRQRDEIKADLHRFTEIDANVTEGVRQCLEWIVRPDRQGGQRKVRRPREDELGSRHVNVR